MRPPTEDDLILHYYGEAADSEAIARALEESPELAARYRQLSSVLDAIPDLQIPETPPDYPARIWRQLQARIEKRPTKRTWLGEIFDHRGALAAAAMLLVVVSFLAGRFSSAPSPDASPPDPSQKILLVTVASHLERSEILLLELANARATSSEDSEASDGLNLSAERLLARELSGANRLYRQAATKAGEQRVASLLDDLERLLVEVANAPDQLQADRLEELQSRLEEADILFKIRVVGSRLRQQTEPDQDNSQSI